MSPPTRLHRVSMLGVVTLLLAAVISVVPVPVFDFVPVASAHVEEPLELVAAHPRVVAEQERAAEDDLGSDRLVGGVGEVEPFSLIGVTFEEPPADPILVRVHDADGWGEWRHLEVEIDEGPDTAEADGARVGTQPLWVGSADGYEVGLSEQDRAHARVVLVRETVQRVVADSTPLADASTTPDGMRTRAQWGAKPSKSVQYASAARLAVVHHSVSSNSYSAADVPAHLRSIQAWHQDGLGWADIGYNFVVDKYGGLWEGRQGGANRPVIGAHAAGVNTGSTGVMILGDYTSVQPSAAAVEATSRVIGWKLALADVSPAVAITITPGTGSPKLPVGQPVRISSVVGHQDVGHTACPGRIQGHLPSIRLRAAEWARWYSAADAMTGALDTVAVSARRVTVTGWAVDPLKPGPAIVRVSVGGRYADITTRHPRSDIAAKYPGSPNAGYALTLTAAPPGRQTVCVTALSSRSSIYNAQIGCRTVDIPK